MQRKKHFLVSFTPNLSQNSMSPESHLNERSGMLAGGNWIIDQVKIIDVYPKHEQLANIFDQSQGTGGSPYNVLLDLAKMGAGFPLEGAGRAKGAHHRTRTQLLKISHRLLAGP